MAKLTPSDYTSYAEVQTTGPGGVTYVVATKKGLQVLCFRPSKSGDGTRCSMAAGSRTDHFGVGACKYHLPANPVRAKVGSRRTGRYSSMFRGDLKRRYEDYLNDHNVFDLTDELAVQRAVLSHAVDKACEEGGDQDQAYWLKQMAEVADKIASTVERVLRIQAIQVVTYPLMQYVVARIMDVLVTSVQRFLLTSGYVSLDAAEEVAKQYAAQYFVPEWRLAVVGASDGRDRQKKGVEHSEAFWKENYADVADDD